MTGFLACVCALSAAFGFIMALAAIINFLHLWIKENDFGAAFIVLVFLGALAALLMWVSSLTYPYMQADLANGDKARNEAVLENREICKTKFTDQAELAACMVDAGSLKVSAL